MNRTQALQEKPLDTIYELLAELVLSYERDIGSWMRRKQHVQI